jgi:hypothetical protein
MLVENPSPPASCLEQADALMLTATQAPPKSAVKPSGQVWAYYSLESGAIYPEMDDPGFMRQFEVARPGALSQRPILREDWGSVVASSVENARDVRACACAQFRPG